MSRGTEKKNERQRRKKIETEEEEKRYRRRKIGKREHTVKESFSLFFLTESREKKERRRRGKRKMKTATTKKGNEESGKERSTSECCTPHVFQSITKCTLIQSNTLVLLLLFIDTISQRNSLVYYRTALLSLFLSFHFFFPSLFPSLHSLPSSIHSLPPFSCFTLSISFPLKSLLVSLSSLPFIYTQCNKTTKAAVGTTTRVSFVKKTKEGR